MSDSSLQCRVCGKPKKTAHQVPLQNSSTIRLRTLGHQQLIIVTSLFRTRPRVIPGQFYDSTTNSGTPTINYYPELSQASQSNLTPDSGVSSHGPLTSQSDIICLSLFRSRTLNSGVPAHVCSIYCAGSLILN